ncbi:uncharacterized protein LOC110648935 [Hevea brasiliensis]|uniref:uncharacterized protein LOC110648935 n=1 Tax=Hevea brasiliensis TaxID=3981 RepID=UPI0025E70CE2|nr:uncharacterized protein LOC110648935 [Hevea brasiliensis]XP_057997617.1 uncharacterized protein LOC110648935 [Hevea brasiliensis]XP_057997618.1 uncharacterized protein LOC110648935 [Hevea brasiliensis]
MVITEQPIGTVLFLVIQGTPALMKVEVLESDMQGNCTLAQRVSETTKPVPGECGYYLHAHQLILLHPTTNEVIKFYSAYSTNKSRKDKPSIDLLR